MFKADSDPQNAPEAKFCLHYVQATRVARLTCKQAHNRPIRDNRRYELLQPLRSAAGTRTGGAARARAAASREVSGNHRHQPLTLALLAQNLKNYVDKVPELWVEAQVASLNGRGGNVFMELKDLNEDFSFTLALFGRAGSAWRLM